MSSLRINQEVVTDPKTILRTWEDHFRALSAANTDQSSTMLCTEKEVDKLMCASLNNDNSLLDTPFVSEEVDAVLKNLKPNKATAYWT